MNCNGVILVTTCTNRKRKPVPPSLQAASLKRSSQENVLDQWCDRLSENPSVGTAAAIYCGRAFREAYAASKEVAGSLWIISAGLGLVSEESVIPSYSITIGRSGPDSISKKIKDGKFSPTEWWRGITAFHGCPDPLHRLIIGNPSKIFVLALSQAYVGLILEDISSLPESDLDRVRLIGLALHPILDRRLRRILMPYDERLDGPGSTNAGTRSDFAQRAMRHFVKEILNLSHSSDPKFHAHLVNESLSGRAYRQIPKRKRLSDQQIIDTILSNWHLSPANFSKMLRIVRDDEQIACEQTRFRNLYRLAKELNHES